MVEDGPLARLIGPDSREDFVVSEPSIDEIDMLLVGRWLVVVDSAGKARPFENGRDVGGARDEAARAY